MTERNALPGEDAGIGADASMAAFAAGHVVAWEMDLESEEIRAGSGLARVLGIDIAPVTSTEAIEHLMMPGETLRLRTTLVDAIKQKDRFVTESVALKTADGRKWLNVRFEIVRDAQERPYLLRGTAMEVGERERLRSEHPRERLWELSRDLLVVMSPAGVMHNTNPAWLRILGWEAAELEGQRIRSILHPDDAPRIVDLYLAKASSSDRFDVECRMLGKDGDYRFVSWTADMFDGDIYGVGRDVTDERRAAKALTEAHEQLAQAKKLEAIGEVTGGIAHDFNNSLTSVIGNLSIAELRLGKSEVVEATHRIGLAMRSARQAAGLAQSLLTFARRRTLKVQPENINQLLSAMREFLDGTVGETISTTLDLDPSLWLAEVDKTHFEAAVLNLAINARDAMSRGGQIYVRTQNLHVDDILTTPRPLMAGDYVLLEVRDTGDGMTDAAIERAFEPFFTTKPEGAGTGLGLPTVYGFVKALGGYVDIESKVGAGTTVRLYLPRSGGCEIQPAAASQAELPPDGVGRRILIVEDNDIVRDLVAELLQMAGYETIEASDATAALTIIESDDPIDLLLCDVGLPGMTGRELADVAVAQRPTLKVLFVTGHAEQRADLAGREVISKPFSAHDLPLRVRAVLET